MLGFNDLIGRGRLELPRAYAQQILSLVCLPIPPPPLVYKTIKMIAKSPLSDLN